MRWVLYAVQENSIQTTIILKCQDEIRMTIDLKQNSFAKDVPKKQADSKYLFEIVLKGIRSL